MTTIAAPQPQEIQRKPPPRWPRVVAISLAEFGKSLDDPDLDQWFEGFSARNSDMAEYEISNTGHLLIREPTGSPGSVYEIELSGDLIVWIRRHGGIAFGSTSCFVLPDGSRFCPDAAWLREERRHEIMLPENLPFPHIVPDFVAEIKSPSNSRAELTAKNQSVSGTRRQAGVVHRRGNPHGHQVPPRSGTRDAEQPGIC